MNFIWITLIVCNVLSIAAHPTSTSPPAPEIQCLKFERKRALISNSNKQLNILNDNTLTSNEDQDEDGDGDDDNNNEIQDNVSQRNTTDALDESAATNVTCRAPKNYCYSVWSIQKDGTSRIERQGCWEHKCNQSACVGYPQDRFLFCCCNESNCNENFVQTTPKTSPVVVPPSESANNREKFFFHSSALWISFLSTGIMLIIIAIVFFLSCNEKSLNVLQETSPLAPSGYSGPGYSSNLYNVDNLRPHSIIGEGKYGTVWKGMINEQPVAIKIFSANKKQYFLNEADIYAQPFMDTSPSLLSYFGCDERLNSDGKIEYLLVLSLADLGCLHDYLRNNTTSFQIFNRMTTSIARGISHLHTRIEKGDMVKMCICHRDINSRNILVKADLSCCICDFGFAMKLNGSRYEHQGEMILAETKSIYEVGTLRYMAPEILEGAVNLRDCETSLKQIDVYSLGLVIWELCMRCQDFYSPDTLPPPYKAPYEAEIGVHPTFDQMRALVLQHKARPLFPAEWGNPKVLQNYLSNAAFAAKEVCEDCWDPDSEARLTALCVEERLLEIATMKSRSHFVPVNITTVSTNNNQNVISITTHTIPPNQLLSPSSPSIEYFGMQKNQPIQQFQGRNLCLERNLVQIHQVDQSSCGGSGDEKPIRKCPINNGNQLINNVNAIEYCDSAEYEILEEVLANRSKSQQPCQSRDVLQKKINKPSAKRWRDIIHKRFHMKKKNNSLNISNIQRSFSSPIHTKSADNAKPNNAKRPNNLDIISPIVIASPDIDEIQSYKAPLNDPHNSFTIIPEPHHMVTSKSVTLTSVSEKESNQLKRQRSLEVFRDVFGPSKMNLRDVQCRVKTPGDLPASVRKVRASKTLSLYDDRDPMDPKYVKENGSL